MLVIENYVFFLKELVLSLDSQNVVSEKNEILNCVCNEIYE